MPKITRSAKDCFKVVTYVDMETFAFINEQAGMSEVNVEVMARVLLRIGINAMTLHQAQMEEENKNNA